MNHRILIVEDEAKLREVLCDYFRSRGELPAQAADGAQVLGMLEEDEFDAVLLDILMPGLDGLSVCRAVRRTSGVPIVFLTALLLSFSMLLLWGVSMACVTNVTAEYAASRMLTDYSEFASVLARRNYDESVGEGNTPGENLLARRQWGAVLDGGRAESFLSGTAWADGEDGFLLPPAANDTVSSAAAVFDAEQVVFYSDRIDLCLARPSPSFSYDGKQYEELKDFICELGPVLIRSSGVRSRFEGTDLLIPSASYCIRSDGVTWPESNWFHPETSDGQELLFCTVSVVVGFPWRMAMSQLKSVYLGSFLLAAALALLLWTLLRRRLIVPARLVAEELAKDERTGWSAPSRRVWREGQRLFEGLARVRRVLQEDAGELGRQKNEITRLNTVLQYAEDAEANRRQLTSSIAHELKTPLAVVHSYAEGLKERIAEKKRDRYLDVILSETERMDAMVLEMLDLSRLEAGRVKLSRDEFSLPALTRAVFDKLERAIESRSGGGTGLGLAIAKNIIELHGGRCFAYNTEKGVAFGFTI